MKIGWINVMPFVRYLVGIPLNLIRSAALIGLPIITMMLQADTEALKPIANVVQQLKEEKAANGGKLAPADSGSVTD
tara:strand:- start:180 stop:410 length:231 start_codon:yes stop_codon:yes gene_type:complete